MVAAVNAPPSCSIRGPRSGRAGSTCDKCYAPAGAATYSWGITGNGSITAGANTQKGTGSAGGAGRFTLTLTVTNRYGCSSQCSSVLFHQGAEVGEGR